MKEIWTKGLKIPRFPQLDGDTSTEILVIGGGMAGVLCAREHYFIPVRSLQAAVSFDVYVKIGHTAHSLEAVGVCPKKEVKGEGSEILIQNRQQLGQLSAG